MEKVIVETERPYGLPSKTYKLRIPQVKEAYYITIVDTNDGGVRCPHEIFISSKNMNDVAHVTTITRLISGMFRCKIPATFIVKELQSIFDPAGGFFMFGKHIPSFSTAIGHIIEQHIAAYKSQDDKGDIESCIQIER